MKFSAFSLVYPATIEWFTRNYNRLHKHFDKWYVVYGFVEPQIKALHDHFGIVVPVKYTEPKTMPYKNLEGGTCTIMQLTEGYFSEKLEMCQAAYAEAAYDGMDYLMQIDADEWYTDEAMLEIKQMVKAVQPNIAPIKQNKYWINYKRLYGGVWEDHPARIFKVNENWNFLDHRPPAIGNEKEQYSRPASIIGHPLCDHFCYVDDNQVFLKSLFFSEIRKDHPTYSKYLDWYFQWYKTYVMSNSKEPWKYHPSEAPRIIDTPSASFCEVSDRYHDDEMFLSSFYNTHILDHE
jgi:hypothetical protein